MITIFGITQETVVNNTAASYGSYSQNNPDVAVDSAGNFVVVWDGINDVNSIPGFPLHAVYGQRFSATPAIPFTASATKLGNEFQINNTDVDNQLLVSVAVSGTGTFVATWTSYDVSGTTDSEYGIYARRYDSITNGNTTSGTNDTHVNTTINGFQEYSNVAMDSLGNYVVVWWGQGASSASGNNDIYIQRFNGSGGVLQGETKVNTTSNTVEQSPIVAMNSSGTFVVVWTEQISGSDEVFYALYNSSGGVIKAPTQANQTTTNAQNTPSVAINDNGEFVIVWQDYRGGNSDIYARKFDGSGNAVSGTVGNDTLVHFDPSGAQVAPDVDIDNNGNFVVVWQDATAEGTSTDGVYARRFTSTGADGDAVLVNQATTNNQIQPAIAMNNNGDFVVTWVSDQVTANDNTIYARQFIVNDAPTDINLSQTSVNENVAVNTAVGAIVGVDPDAPYDNLTYSLVAGIGSTDNGSFNISGNQLRLNISPDFENKDSYNIRLRVTDQGTLVFEKPFVITINDVNEPPTNVTFTNTTTSIAENTNTASPIKVADISVVDDALGSENLTLSGADAASFTIIGNALYIQSGVSLNFEAKSAYSVTVNVDDPTVGATPDVSQTFNLSVTDVNEAPTAVNLLNTTTTIAENSNTSSAIKLADISITDDALGTETLSLSGADANSFTIVSNALYLKAGVVLDYETKSTYNVTVNVDDTTVGATPDVSSNFTLTLTDVNEAPTTANFINTTTTLAENSDTSSAIKVADISISDDALGSENLTLTGADANSFTIISNALYLKAGVALDYETQSTYNVTVQVDDPTVGATPDFTLPFTLTLTDINEAPTAVNFTNATTTLAENTDTSSAIKVADISITDDALGTNTLTLTGTDANSFTIVSNALYLKAGVVLDYETKSTYNVTVQVDDSTVGATPDVSSNFTLTLTDVNEAPTAASLINTTTTLAENSDTSSAIKVADISITDDALGTETLTLTGADAATFIIIGSALYLKAGVSLDYETQSTYNVTVQVDDPTVGATPDFTLPFTLTLTNINEAPTAVNLANTTTTLAENSDTSSAIKVADINITDDALGTNTLTLTGADAGAFTIIGSALYLQSGVTLNYENKSTYNVTVNADDSTVGTTPDVSSNFTLTLTDVNEAPTAVNFANTTTSLAENSDTSSAIKVADISVTDDALGTNTLTLTGADAGAFTIIGSALYLKAGVTLNYETQSTYNVTVNADDSTVGANPDVTLPFTLTLTDVNEAPTAVNFANTITTLAENTNTSSAIKVADISITDDALGTETLSLTSADAGAFTIIGSALYLQSGVTLNYENKSTYNVTVNVDDTTVGTTPDFALPFTLTLTDVNEAPTAVNLTNTTTTLAENSDTSSAIKVADINITDDALGSENLTLTGADAGAFTIISNALYLKAEVTLDYETKSTYNVTVQVDDSTVGATPDVSSNFTLTLTDVNEAPTGVNFANTITAIAENTSTASRIKVADITITDPDGGTNNLSLSGTDAAYFEIDTGVLYLKATTTLDYEIKSTYNVTVSVDDPTLGATPDASGLFTLNVTNLNDNAPILAVISNVNLAENAPANTLIATASATDADGTLNPLIYSLISPPVDGTNQPLFAIDSNTGAITLTTAGAASIDFESATKSYGLQVQVSDGTFTNTQSFNVNLTDANEAPQVANSIEDITVDANTNFNFTFAANTFSDVDTGDILSYNATLADDSILPNWLSFNADTRTFSGTPPTSGNFKIKVTAKDKAQASVDDVFTLAVNSTQQFTQLINSSNDIFQISSSQTTTKLQVALTGHNSQLVNELAVFTVDDDNGTINGIAPGTAGYVEAAIARSSVIFSAIAKIPNGFDSNNLNRTLELASNQKFRFALIKNNTFDAFKAGVASSADIMFSDASNQKITNLGNNLFSLGWQDGSNNNVSEFNDLVVNVQATDDALPLGTNLQSNSQGEMIDLRNISGAVTAKFTVNREASYDSFVGFYQVTDVNGGIDTNHDGVADVLVGQASYLQAAVNQRVAGISLTVNNQGTATYTSSFAGGGIFVPFIIVNGRPEAVLDNNHKNDPAVYFPLLGANSDKSDHIRLLGNNVFGFEDLPSLGDKDYNDMIVKVDLSIA
ncbi:cadherin domain-containing protein [Nostoc sp. FACHB-145]|uniref:cadherin domain-containing protein n=1 Tax=Nostoc sp. FACHB-145 TaxID=2692836 RepID=UPI001682B409|nr:cadherin domain-containing protein [Nostoc sp. FACHB-145]MBD2472961.1 cadherin domain-containing protein [Nostoc sp. FACHB-145]